MRQDNGTLLIKELKVPLEVQAEILPLLLHHIPNSYHNIGINFNTYWDFDSKTRKAFIIIAVRNYLYPSIEQFKTILVKENKTALEQWVSWVHWLERNHKELYEKWISLLEAAFNKMTAAEQLRVWKKAQTELYFFVHYVTREFLPVALLHISDDPCAQKQRVISIIEKRMKGGKIPPIDRL